MKKKQWIIAATGLVALALAGGGWLLVSGSGEQVSPGPAAVIQAAFVCPNDRLFNMEAITPMGEGVVLTEEDKARIETASEQVKENWKEDVGEYFAPACWESFIMGPANQFLMSAALMGQTVEIKKIELVEKGSLYENVLVTISRGGQQSQVLTKFSLDEEGLITRVEFIQTN